MKPLFMKLTQGTKTPVWVNMCLVAHIMPNIPDGSVLTFNVALNDEPAYLCVLESPDEIGNRSEWRV